MHECECELTCHFGWEPFFVILALVHDYPEE
jgi:hypothetical protein